MKLLDRYVAKAVLGAIGLVTLMLAGLQIFILFVNQLDDIGKGDFGIIQATVYVMMQMPYQVYLFFPMASLMGCLIGLGILASHHELVVMRAAGMSIGQITKAVLKASLLIILIVTAVGETAVPELSLYGNDYKMQTMSGGKALRTGHGIWLRSQNDFISIGAILPDNVLDNVYQFRFDNQHRMQLARRIDKARFVDSQWIATGVFQTEIQADSTKATQIERMPWDVTLKPKLLKLSSTEPDEMTLHELRQFLREKKRANQSATNYQFAYWQRLVQPLSTMVMMILAIPFIFGPLRSSTMGSKLLAGITVGFGFHIMNRFFGPVSQVFQWPPLIAALGPTLFFALLGLFLMRRVR